MGNFNLTGQTHEFHQGRYRAKITLSTPDGRVTTLESDDFDTTAEAEASMKATMDRLLEDFKKHGTEIVSRTEERTNEQT